MLRFAAFLFALTPALAGAQTITSSNESTPHPGIRIVEGRTSGPGTNFYAAYVSLCTDAVRVDASPYGSTGSAASWGSSSGAKLATNGDFYTGSPRLHVYGDAVAGGQRWAMNRTGLDSDYSGDWYYNKYGWIAFGPDWVDFTNTEFVKNRGLSSSGWRPNDVAPDPPPGTTALVSGFPQLVIDGEVLPCANPPGCFADRGDMSDRHPRTAMGLSQDKQTFMLVVVDGRSSSSAGMYGHELAKLMRDLGAHTAFNLDGGGSAQMWVRGDGTINRPSDGSPRSVPNHWGVFSGGTGLPASCDNSWDGLLHVMAGQVKRATDLDGDGRGDACIRTATGVECSLSSDGGFGPPVAGPTLGDDSGWADPTNYTTMRWGDINGDGRADLCARANAGMRCWPFDGAAFGEAIVGPELSDDNGFDAVGLHSTIRLADIDGDGMDDICARWTDGMRCYPSTGTGFGEAIVSPELSDESGWGDVSNYGTIRVGDVDGDGTDDICARANARMYCWTSGGARLDGPEWSDAAGWNNFRQWSTIRLVDLDDDGRADLCGRSAIGVECAMSTGEGFSPVIVGPELSDDSGWADYSNFSTLRFADVTGDGILDVCARADAGVRCWPFDGTSFGAAFGDLLVDTSGWTNDRYHRTIDFVDVDADGKADLCARAARGLLCWRSLGNAFDETFIEGPAWSDESGFSAKKFYGTMTLLGAVRPAPVVDPDPAGTTGGSGGGGDAEDPDAPSTPNDPTTPATDDRNTASGSEVITAEGGCSTVSVGGGAPALLLLAFFGIWARRHRRDLDS